MFTKRPLTTTTFFTSLPSMAWETASSACGLHVFLRGVGSNRDLGLHLAVHLHRQLHLVSLSAFSGSNSGHGCVVHSSPR